MLRSTGQIIWPKDDKIIIATTAGNTRNWPKLLLHPKAEEKRGMRGWGGRGVGCKEGSVLHEQQKNLLQRTVLVFLNHFKLIFTKPTKNKAKCFINDFVYTNEKHWILCFSHYFVICVPPLHAAPHTPLYVGVSDKCVPSNKITPSIFHKEIGKTLSIFLSF